LSQLVKGEDRGWGKFILESFFNQEVPEGFPLKKGVFYLFPDHLVLMDWERWKSGGGKE
jgi:hypothetical protein